MIFSIHQIVMNLDLCGESSNTSNMRIGNARFHISTDNTVDTGVKGYVNNKKPKCAF